MTSELFTDEAVVCGLVPYGDSDLVVRLFGRVGGRVTAFARGARRSKRRFAGSLQPLAQGVAGLKARRGAELLSLESFEASSPLFGLADDPGRLGRAAYLVEISERLLPEAEPAPALFASLGVALSRLASGEGDARLLRAFELRLLDETGYLPDLGSASDDPGRAPAFLDQRTGALVAVGGAGCVPFGASLQAAAVALLSSPLGEPPALEQAALRAVGRLFSTHMRLMGVTGLKSVAFLKSLER